MIPLIRLDLHGAHGGNGVSGFELFVCVCVCVCMCTCARDVLVSEGVLWRE